MAWLGLFETKAPHSFWVKDAESEIAVDSKHHSFQQTK